MTSPAQALGWELWRRNRWGLVALALLLCACGLMRLEARRLQARVTNLASRDPNRLVVPLSELVAAKAGELGPLTLRLSQGRSLLFERAVNAAQLLDVQARFSGTPELVVTLKSPDASEEVLYTGPLRSRNPLAWATLDGRRGELPIIFDPSYPEELALATADSERWREAAFAWSLLLLGFGVLVLLGIFGVAEPNPARGFTGIPPRRFTLPVSTELLVGLPLVLGQAAIVLIYFAWAWAVSPDLLPPGTGWSHFYFALLLAAGLAWFQALVWGLPSFPRLRASLLTVLVIGILVLAVLPTLARTASEESLWLTFKEEIQIGLMAAWALGIAMAWVGVRLERSGAWLARASAPAFVQGFARMGPRAPEFRSARGAQFWMEWRRNGRVALAVWVPLVWVCVGCELLARTAYPGLETVSQAVSLVGMLAATCWAGIAGLNLARDGSSKQLTLSSFTAVRPITSGEMVQAKVLVALTVWAGGALVIGISWLMAVGVGGFSQMWPVAPGAAIGLALISLHLVIGILPLCLTGRLPGFPWSLLPLLLVYGLASNGVTWFARHSHYLPLLFALLSLLVTVKLAVAFWAFRRSILLQLSGPSWVLGYAFLWVGCAFVIGLWAWAQADRGAEDALPLLPGLVLLLPLARIALAPLALDMNRHR